ncbi:MAG: YceI family protein [Salibacteraceae bacterium]
MKLNTLLITLVSGTVMMAFSPIEVIEKLKIKPEASTIEWYAEKVTGKHNVVVSLKDGIIEIEGNKLKGGSFNVDMTSIVVTDLEGEYKGKLEGHLKSPDFFDVEKHKTASFKITQVSSLKDDSEFNTKITGDLTIKGTTHPISFPAKVEIKEGKFAAYGEMVIDRSRYNVRYGSTSFFDDLGDKAIYDKFTMKVSIGAKR